MLGLSLLKRRLVTYRGVVDGYHRFQVDEIQGTLTTAVHIVHLPFDLAQNGSLCLSSVSACFS